MRISELPWYCTVGSVLVLATAYGSGVATAWRFPQWFGLKKSTDIKETFVHESDTENETSSNTKYLGTYPTIEQAYKK
mgnify:CR=1 FL=1